MHDSSVEGAPPVLAIEKAKNFHGGEPRRQPLIDRVTIDPV
jgi:hypothetical protein